MNSARTMRAEVRAVVRGAPDSEQCLSGATRRQSLQRSEAPEPQRLGDVASAPDSVRWRTRLSGAPIDSSHPQWLCGG
jgi:hypothetical protein